jgi:hypothetical protein
MPANWRGANFERTDKRWTHFDWVADGRNYIRGDTQIDGKATFADEISLDKSIIMNKGDPGPMIERKYGVNVGDRYGIGQFDNGQMRMYAADAYGPATVNLSFANANGSYNDVVKVDRSGKMKVRKDGQICINDTCITENTLKNIINRSK